MLELPVLPDSVAIAVDDGHVFLSFHWDQQSNYLARDLAQKLSPVIEKFLFELGMIVVLEEDGLNNG